MPAEPWKAGRKGRLGNLGSASGAGRVEEGADPILSAAVSPAHVAAFVAACSSAIPFSIARYNVA